VLLTESKLLVNYSVVVTNQKEDEGWKIIRKVYLNWWKHILHFIRWGFTDDSEEPVAR
jgi:hypothetical protein